ncbi:MAG: TIM barrel protein, partial [Candidatus ainarchaeum sp.]|nr:TIM barrel protein [Candidatus ainarchaeum sp.]
MMRFGPAGIPIQCEGGTAEGIECCKQLGLGAMEMEFVRGVKMGDEAAKQAGKKAKELDIKISSHAPYYVNLCTSDRVKAEGSKRHIFLAAKATFLANGWITVFHPGFYQKLGKEEAFQAAKKRLLEIKEKMDAEKIKCILGAETVGKKSAFGGFDENIRLAKELDFVEPVLDFSHLHARRDFLIKGEEEYRKIFSMMEKEVGDYVNHFHSHFSEINYSEKGELNHIPLDSNSETPFRPLMKVIAENGYSGTI